MGRLRTNIEAPNLIKEFDNYCEIVDYKFSKNKKLFVEIGCGKGDFLINQALTNKNVNFLGVEKYSTVILKALKKIKRNKLNLPNLKFTCLDASALDIKQFSKKINKLFLNFSDPWPKKRHAKRRLTSPLFLDLYKKMLSKDAIVEFKTDNDGLYEYSLETLKSRKDIKVLYNTNDLYKDLNNKWNKNNVQTEYEKKFVALNKNINKIIFEFK